MDASPRRRRRLSSGGRQASHGAHHRRVAAERFAGRYTRLVARFRGPFCCVDAYAEPAPPSPGWPPPGWGETREGMLERMRPAPVHLCRLRSCSDEERWGFAFYAYSDERSKLAGFPSGEFFGPPEEALRVSAGVYL